MLVYIPLQMHSQLSSKDDSLLQLYYLLPCREDINISCRSFLQTFLCKPSRRYDRIRPRSWGNDPHLFYSKMVGSKWNIEINLYSSSAIFLQCSRAAQQQCQSIAHESRFIVLRSQYSSQQHLNKEDYQQYFQKQRI
ncbi:hypothetical protein FGO68_gene16749 [Halteria grandinella]|uniref:Uncharacterized protein n=1 Tax=Halteria grandinella TaxID=5974 RepID=A0A8J8NKE0_HALGN|nr:hypothetical protein FGO68_gene16749 [Halteria grandinella]